MGKHVKNKTTKLLPIKLNVDKSSTLFQYL
jgi:hypothetical protein